MCNACDIQVIKTTNMKTSVGKLANIEKEVKQHQCWGGLLVLQFSQKINGQTSKFGRKLHFLGIWKVINIGLKAEKPLQNENHTEDWALGSHPRDNGHVTH